MSLELNYDNIRDILDYDASNGKFYFKEILNESFFGTSKYRSSKTRMKHFNTINFGKEALKNVDKNGYKRGFIFGNRYLAHRVAWLWYYGNWPVEEIDHLNHIRDDNRIENLREVSREENSKNKVFNNKERYGHYSTR